MINESQLMAAPLRSFTARARKIFSTGFITSRIVEELSNLFFPSQKYFKISAGISGLDSHVVIILFKIEGDVGIPIRQQLP